MVDAVSPVLFTIQQSLIIVSALLVPLSVLSVPVRALSGCSLQVCQQPHSFFNHSFVVFSSSSALLCLFSPSFAHTCQACMQITANLLPGFPHPSSANRCPTGFHVARASATFPFADVEVVSGQSQLDSRRQSIFRWSTSLFRGR